MFLVLTAMFYQGNIIHVTYNIADASFCSSSEPSWASGGKKGEGCRERRARVCRSCRGDRPMNEGNKAGDTETGPISPAQQRCNSTAYLTYSKHNRRIQCLL